MKETIYSFNSNQKYFVTMVQVADPGLRLDLMRYVEQESLCVRYEIITDSREIKMNDFGISDLQLETIVFLTNEVCLARLREILDEFDLIETETTFSYESCPEKIIKMLGLL